MDAWRAKQTLKISLHYTPTAQWPLMNNAHNEMCTEILLGFMNCHANTGIHRVLHFPEHTGHTNMVAEDYNSNHLSSLACSHSPEY